jgi:hypothetical protein
LGGNPSTANIRTVRQVENNTLRGVMGFFAIAVEWTNGGTWYLQNERYSDEHHPALNDEQWRTIKGIGHTKPLDQHDYTRDWSGLPIHLPPVIVDLPAYIPEPANYGIAAA